MRRRDNALRYSLSRRNFFFYTSTAKVTKIYFLSFSNLELFVCAPVLSHESSFLLLKRHLSQVYCHGRGKSFKKKLCVSWALSLVECVAVWALKLPVPHTDAFKTHSSQSFFLNYWNPKNLAINICYSPIISNSVSFLDLNTWQTLSLPFPSSLYFSQ